jgi:rhodanese-related sulfurtransferase
MKKIILTLLISFSLFLISCSSKEVTTASSGYEPTIISASVGKSMLDNNSDIILLDVREESEYLEAHIPGAMLFPLGFISTNASTLIPDKTRLYIVYCHSGNRSSQAADILSQLGYAFIYDMGGIINWPYETVSGIE